MEILLNGEPCYAEFNITTDPPIAFEQLFTNPPEGLKTTTEIICKRGGVTVQRFVIAQTLGDNLPELLSSDPLTGGNLEMRTANLPTILTSF